MKPILTSIFPVFSLGGVVHLCFALFLCINVDADEFSNIGSGSPGLRIITSPENVNAVVIYRELPETPFGGYIDPNVATNEIIQVIIEHGYDFQKARADVHSLSGPTCSILKLYPFGLNSGFADEAGVEWFWRSSSDSNYWARLSSHAVGYTLTNESLTVFTNVEQVARAKYNLSKDEIFLGFLDNRIFFCKNGSRPSEVFWREEGSQKEYFCRMPRAVVNVYGVMKALHPDKDVGFVVLRRRPVFSNIWAPPNLDDFVEISLSSGKLLKDGGR